MKTILWIPDGQNDPGRPIGHYLWVSLFIAFYKPDIIIVAGDWNDCGHFSHHDAGTRLLWGKSHQKSCDRSREALALLMSRWPAGYRPELHALSGNHDGGEDDRGTRMERMVRKYPAFAQSLECPMECFRDRGWAVHPYKEVVMIEGIAFSHLFNLTSTGKAERSEGTGARTPVAQVSALGCSAVAGHRQGYHFDERSVNGKLCQGLIAGSCYSHEEPYLGVQGGNNHFNGIVWLNPLEYGSFDPERWSLTRLQKEFG